MRGCVVNPARFVSGVNAHKTKEECATTGHAKRSSGRTSNQIEGIVMKQMKQECPLINVWLTWIGVPALAIAMGMLTYWWAGGFVLVAGVFAQFYYVRMFPRISRLLGYGSVENVKASAPAESRVTAKVILYTANVCPFCPIVKKRLAELQRELKFELEEKDITFRQDIVREKGLRSVPVVETDGRYWVGNATTAQLVEFLTHSK